MARVENLVLGDIMVDRFVYGHVERISPEAPIPILHHRSERCMLGGPATWRATSLPLAERLCW